MAGRLLKCTRWSVSFHRRRRRCCRIDRASYLLGRVSSCLQCTVRYVLPLALLTTHAPPVDASSFRLAYHRNTRVSQALLDRLDRAVVLARGKATQRLLLLQLFETRMFDERLLPGGEYEVPLQLTEGIELHERIRSDKLRALKTAFDALQPLGVSGRSDIFVYRTSGEDGERKVFVLQLSLVEGEEEADHVQLNVLGLDEPTEEITRGLVGHLREKLEELTMAKFAL